MEPERKSAILGIARSAERVGARGDLFRALVMEADGTKSAALERSLLLRAAEIASSDLSDADTALDLVKRVLQKNGGDTQALRLSFRIHQRTGRHEEAVAQLRLLLQHVRKGPTALAIAIEIATTLELRLRRQGEALVAYREARLIDPTHPLPPAEIRRILLASEDYRALAEELIAMSTGGDTPASRGRMLLEAAEIYGDRLDEHDRAITACSRRGRTCPTTSRSPSVSSAPTCGKTSLAS